MKKKHTHLGCRKRILISCCIFLFNRSKLLLIVIMLPFAIRTNISHSAHEYQGKSGNNWTCTMDSLHRFFPTKVTSWSWLKIYNTHTQGTEFTSVVECGMDWAFITLWHRHHRHFYLSVYLYYILETSETFERKKN